MPSRDQSFISIASYNVLCDSYIKPEYYPLCDPSAFRPERRHPLLLERVAGLGTDVICLQEVDAEMYERLARRLDSEGYGGRWSQKEGNKPDGCATFVRRSLRVVARLRQAYQDGRDDRRASGHIAQLTMLVTPEGHSVMVVNTHLKWEAADVLPEARYGFAQASELVLANTVAGSSDGPLPLIICGDFNEEYGSETMQVFARAGFQDSHLGNMAPTCLPNGQARKIDAILSNDRFLVHDFSTPPISDTTPLPSATEPSDHVPICATLVTAAY